MSKDPWLVTTGIPGLDESIGGWRKGGLTTLYGVSSVSSQESLILRSCETLAKRGLKVLCLDINGSLHVQDSSDNLTLIDICDWGEQKNIIADLFRMDKLLYDVVFVNGLTNHYHAEFITVNEEESPNNMGKRDIDHIRDKIHAELCYMVYQLSILARRNNIPIVASNYSISKEKYYIPFIGGGALGYYSKVVLFTKPISPHPWLAKTSLHSIVEEFGYENIWILAVEKDPSALISNRIVILLMNDKGYLTAIRYYQPPAKTSAKAKRITKETILQKRRDVVPSGFPALDLLLEGGFRRKNLTLVFGPTMIGKSYLLRQISVKTADKGYNVLYFDLENSFDPSVEIDFYATNVADHIANALQRIEIKVPNSIEQLDELVKNLIFTLKFYDLLVIDHIVYHFYPLIRTVDSVRKYALLDLLENIVENVKKYAITTNSAVIISSGTRRSPGTLSSLGGALVYELAQKAIKIMPTSDWSCRKLTIIDKTSNVSKIALMRIGDGGEIQLTLGGQVCEM